MLNWRKLKHKLGMPRKYVNYALPRTRVRTYPDRLYVESTNECNLKCIMCPNGLGLMERPRGFMEFGLFKKIMDEMAPHVRASTIHIWGEPLLHPRIIEMIHYGKRHGAKLEMSTNATLLDEETAGRLLDSELNMIYLCLDGTTKETYEAIRRKSDYETTVANIQRFIEMKDATGRVLPNVFLQIVEMKPTKAQIEEFKRRWTVPGVTGINVKAFDSWGSQVEEINRLRDDQRRAPATRYHCPNLWYHAHIYWDGTLVCCDRDYDAKYPLGNVAGGVMKAWNGPEMTELRRKHLTGDLADVPSCENCVEWSWWRPGVFKARGNAPEK
jgi:organic radical activating enzyme